mmetsp:Transcript_46769/g.53943  ORF Transcript_46769/g.53943 Transcript_46769/m.53943 type:complete len:134 (-) Transcript_46769:53-454(-)
MSKKATRKKERDLTEKNKYDPSQLEVVIPEDGWIIVNFILRELQVSHFTEYFRSSTTVYLMRKTLYERHGRIDNITIYKGHTAEFPLEEETQPLAELFETYGAHTKGEAPSFDIIYDFVPHNMNDPVLLGFGV